MLFSTLIVDVVVDVVLLLGVFLLAVVHQLSLSLSLLFNRSAVMLTRCHVESLFGLAMSCPLLFCQVALS